jgi:hypothetical protein
MVLSPQYSPFANGKYSIYIHLNQVVIDTFVVREWRMQRKTASLKRARAGHASHHRLFRRGNRPLNDGIGEVNLGGLGFGEAGFEGVAQGHEFVDFGDDAVLLGERRQSNRQVPNLFSRNILHRAASSTSHSCVVLARMLAPVPIPRF